MNASVVLALSLLLGDVAQDGATGPIRGSIARASALLAQDTVPTSGSETPGAPDEWARVRSLRVATLVFVATRGESLRKRYIVDVDGEGLTLLNLENPALSRELKARLLSILASSTEPENSGSADEVARGTRQMRDGLFAEANNLLDRSQLLERVERRMVREVRIAGLGKGSRVREALVGLGCGAVLGYVVGSTCGPGAARSECHAYGMYFAMTGGGIGAAIGAITAASEHTVAIYHAP
jgi:hypothetical protein